MNTLSESNEKGFEPERSGSPNWAPLSRQKLFPSCLNKGHAVHLCAKGVKNTLELFLTSQRNLTVNYLLKSRAVHFNTITRESQTVAASFSEYTATIPQVWLFLKDSFLYIPFKESFVV